MFSWIFKKTYHPLPINPPFIKNHALVNPQKIESILRNIQIFGIVKGINPKGSAHGLPF